MAIKFQYNKTSLQSLDKQLKMRVRALPTIKNKESALRSEVKKAKEVADEFDGKLDDTLNGISDMLQLYDEYTPDILTVKDVNMSVKKIAGVRTPVLDQVEYEIKDFSLFNAPGWFLDGIQHVKEVVNIALEREFYMRKMELLDRARKKTTQKVNLYEKVQIPGFQEAIRKIKRFLEDEENLSKSAQKIVKTRKAMEDEVDSTNEKIIPADILSGLSGISRGTSGKGSGSYP
ncbi:MAG: V-type ATP synthase subunit D [Odoribacter splanchnicus]